MSGLGVFGDIANSLGPFVGGADIAGFLLGFVTVVVLTVVIALAIGERFGANGIWIGFGITIILVSLIQWFPPWTPLFIVVIYLASKYFGSSEVSIPG